METAFCMSVFALLLFSTSVNLSPNPELVFGLERGHDGFPFPEVSEVDSYVLSRVSKDGGRLLLVNSSQLQIPQPDGCNITYSNSQNSFEMTNLTMSQSGDYRVEGWQGENITGVIVYRLTVCAEGNEEPSVSNVTFDATVELCQSDSTPG